MAPDRSLVEDLLAVATEAVGVGAAVTMARFGAPDLAQTAKTTVDDIVTDADRACEAAVLGVLASARPGDGFVAEEGSCREGSSGVTWVLDPIDSTANFARGLPSWSVSLAARVGGVTEVGVVSCPPTDEVVTATRRSGVQLNGLRVPPRPQRELRAAVAVIGWERGIDGIGDRIEALIAATGRVRSPGSPALGLAWTALGRYDLAYYEMSLQEWDKAAGLFLCECAGLTVRDGGVLAGVGAWLPGFDAALLRILVGTTT